MGLIIQQKEEILHAAGWFLSLIWHLGECNKLGLSVNLNGNFDLDVEVVIWVCLIDSDFDWQTCFFEGKKESLFVLCNYCY